MSISKFPGALITKNPVTPTGPYENGSAPGIWTLTQVANYVKQGIWPTAGLSAADSYFEYVTMLLHGDGTNGGQNNTFLDSSTNNFTITRSGNTMQGSLSPYGSLWSNYFDGSGDYLTTGSSANFGMGTGTFTFECWVFPTANPANGVGTVFDARSGASAEGWVIRVFADRTVGLYDGPSNAYVYSTGTVTLNQWNHIAVVRSSTSSGGVAFYINGAAAGTATVASNLGTSWVALIGTNRSAGYEFNGYISNLRVVKGATVYTGAFTPSTTPLTTYGSGTNALLTCQSNRFIDNSGNSLSITPSGNTSVTNFAPFNPTAAYSTATNGGSGYFDGGGDILSAPANAAFQLTGDFTLETWVYLTASTAAHMIFGSDVGASSDYFAVTPTRVISCIGGNTYPEWTNSFALNTWYHVALTRSSGTLRAFVNGVQLTLAQGSASNSSQMFQSGSVLFVGRYGNSSNPLYFNGYMSNARIVKGTAVYTAGFTPPTAPVSAITNTSLLLNFTNAAIFDNAMKNDLETVGNAQISTSIKKYGTGSLSMLSAGDYCRGSQPSITADINGGDFTIEFWVYFTSLAGDRALVSKYGPLAENTGGSGYVLQWVQSSSVLRFVLGVGGTTDNLYTWSWAPSTSTWYHVAVTRSGTSARAFINGTQIGSTLTVTTGDVASPNPIQIGKTHTVAQYLLGYIDDFRLTKGIARYTANFTPPTDAFPNF